MNGAQVNPPDFTVANRKQAFDQRGWVLTVNNVVQPRTSRSDFDATLQTRYPLPMAPSITFVKVASRTLANNNSDQRSGLFEDSLTIAFVREMPPAGACMPNPCRPAPSIIRPYAVDVAGIMSRLPNLDLSTTAPLAANLVREALDYLEKFNPTAQYMAAAHSEVGYETLSCANLGYQGGNYGRSRGSMVARTSPLLYANPTSIGLTLADKERAVKAYMRQGHLFEGWKPGADGGHFQFHAAPLMFKRWVLGETQFDLDSMESGNMGQFLLLTPELISEIKTPHRDDTKFTCSRIRSVSAVSGQTVTVNWPGSKAQYHDLVLRQFNGAKAAKIVGCGDDDKTIAVFTLEGTTNPFSIGDEVWLDTPWPLNPGDASWHLNWSRRHESAATRAPMNMSPNARYRKISKPADVVNMANALGIWHPSWVPLWKHVETYKGKNFPVAAGPDGTEGSYIFHYYWSAFASSNSLDDQHDTWGLRIYNSGAIANRAL